MKIYPVCLAGLAAFLLFGSAHAEVPLTAKEVNLDFRGAISTRAYYPKRALKEKLTGRANIICSIEASGDVSKCEVLDETPPEFGFGKAAIKLASKWRAKELNGAPPIAGRRIKFNIEFAL